MVPIPILVRVSFGATTCDGISNGFTGHNSIILMIEAQSRYLNAMVSAVIHARQQGKTLSLKPTEAVMKEYNDRIQTLLSNSSFADPNCNSWYKTDDGIITNNWSGTVLDYQEELSKMNWEDYIAEGSGNDLVKKRSTHLGRVREETLFSNTSLLVGAVGAMAVAGGYLARSKLVKATARLKG